MYIGYLCTKFHIPGNTGSLVITIKTTNKEWFQSHIITVHTTEIYFNIIEYFSEVHYH